jgi:Protein of unknown function (DUF4239)
MQGFAQSIEGGISIILAASALAVSTLVLLHKYWPPQKRVAHNDMVGPSVSVIGTTYAVIIAFMLSGVWNNFQSAQINAEEEANCLVNIYRFAERFPAPQGLKVQQIAIDYSSAMISDEWPAMEHENSSARGHELTQALWRILPSIEATNFAQQNVIDHAISQLTTMTEHRRIRLLQSHQSLPGILWSVLIIGGIITVGSTCLFGVENFRLHLLQVFAITLILSVMLVAIAEIDRPFQGDVRVAPDGFRYALQSFDKWEKESGRK